MNLPRVIVKDSLLIVYKTKVLILNNSQISCLLNDNLSDANYEETRNYLAHALIYLLVNEIHYSEEIIFSDFLNKSIIDNNLSSDELGSKLLNNDTQQYLKREKVKSDILKYDLFSIESVIFYITLVLLGSQLIN